jgi:outer membrane protein
MADSNTTISWIALGVAVVAAIGTVWTQLATPLYGYTDLVVLLERYPKALEVRAEVESALAPARSKVKEQSRLVQGVATRIQAEKANLTSADLVALELQLLKARQRLDELDEQVQELDEGLTRKRMQPVIQQLDKQLQAFGEQQGYEMIWTPTTTGNLAFASNAADVTDDLLAWIALNPAPSEAAN